MFEDNNGSSDDEVDDNYILSDDDGEPDEISGEEHSSNEDDSQSSQQSLFVNESDSSSFKSRNNSEILTTDPKIPLQGRIRVHNIVRERNGPTKYANRNVNDLASAFSLFFRDSLLEEICVRTNKGYQKLKEKWKLINNEELKRFIGALMLIGVYKSKGEAVFQL